jgi:XTP/dITP diphosphohydrolase
MDILLATNNRHKAEEMAALLAGIEGVNIVTLGELPEKVSEPVEDGETLEANAYIKAREVFVATGIPTIADDTGLEVAALDGGPGVYSARYAGDGATYADNCRKLQLEIAGAADRSARFRTVVCYTDQYRTLFAEGSVEGVIVEEPRGNAGFGYDPLFAPAGGNATFAEMSPEEKNSISHRARALAALRDLLTTYITDNGELTNG